MKEETVHRYIVEYHHPHTIAVDIKGNFHRGLMIGLVFGNIFGLGLGLIILWVTK